MAQQGSAPLVAAMLLCYVYEVGAGRKQAPHEEMNGRS